MILFNNRNTEKHSNVMLTNTYPRFSPILGANFGSPLYGDVPMMERAPLAMISSLRKFLVWINICWMSEENKAKRHGATGSICLMDQLPKIKDHTCRFYIEWYRHGMRYLNFDFSASMEMKSTLFSTNIAFSLFIFAFIFCINRRSVAVSFSNTI